MQWYGRIRERGFSNPRLTADKNVRAPMSARSEGRHAGRPLLDPDPFDVAQGRREQPSLTSIKTFGSDGATAAIAVCRYIMETFP
jgi:hypothetical protein